MYIRSRETEGFGEPPATAQYKSPFSSGGEYIGESDTQKLLKVLSGPSLFQSYIQKCLASKEAKALPKSFIRVVASPQEVPDEHLRNRFTKQDGKLVGGTIDRRRGIIYLLEIPGVRGYTRFEYALHEAIHLFAHPIMTIVDDRTFETNYGRACRRGDTDVGTFQRKYCAGFGEGATQLITQQIMKKQGISELSEKPYKEFIPPVVELCKIFSPDKFARAYFWGAVKEFTAAMEYRWGGAWQNVANIAAAGATKMAMDQINHLELQYIQRRGPKGDYPTLPAFKSYA